MSFLVKTEQFEGPLDLLLSLIEKRKLFVNDISLANVTEEYISYANVQNEYNIEEKTSFLVIATTLILIKSRSLLPNLSLTTEESVQIEVLEDRLKLYAIARKIGESILEMYGKNILFSGASRKNDTPIFTPDKKVNLEVLQNALNNVINNLPKEEKLPEINVERMMSIEEMMENLHERIGNAVQASFHNISGGQPKTKEEKVFVIVSFLAMLELVRQGIIDVLQNDIFEDITIEKPIQI